MIATVGHFDFNEEFKGPFFGNSDWRGIPLSLSRDHYVLDCRFEDDEKGGDLGGDGPQTQNLSRFLPRFLLEVGSE